jgi:integrase
MEDKTRADYISIAENFIKRYVAEPVTTKGITDALIARAGEYRPDYWRRLRKGLEIQQRELGFDKAAAQIAGTKNPVTKTKEARAAVKPKQKRVRSVKPQDTEKLINEATSQGLHELAAALYVVAETGARPAELPGIRMTDDGVITITGVKKIAESDDQKGRGADRTLRYHGDMNNMSAALAWMRNADVSKLQQDVRTFVRQVWPTRKWYPSFYSWRHQMGSNLKSSGFTREQIAYVMGHQSVESVDKYGNRRSAKGRVSVVPDESADLSAVRDPTALREEAKKEAAEFDDFVNQELAPKPSGGGGFEPGM